MVDNLRLVMLVNSGVQCICKGSLEKSLFARIATTSPDPTHHLESPGPRWIGEAPPVSSEWMETAEMPMGFHVREG